MTSDNNTTIAEGEKMGGDDTKNDAFPSTTASTATNVGGGGQGADVDNNEKSGPALVTNGTSNETTKDGDKTTMEGGTDPKDKEGKDVDVGEATVAVEATAAAQEDAIDGESEGRDQSDGVKIKTATNNSSSAQPVDVEMISTEMVSDNIKAAINSKKSAASKSMTGEGGGRRSRPSTPSKLDIEKQPTEDDDDDDEHVIPPHIQKQQAIVETSPAERYIRFKEKLGSGAYKDVYRAYDTIEGIEVAWNVVKLGGVPKAERVRIVNEVRLLERLHHPNIISFHGSWVNRETERVIFVTEILSSGTLKSFVQKVQLIRWKIFKRWTIQILKGLEYLHSQDPPIIHRDLKCDNIFINGTSGDLRIGDFGLSTAISKKNQPLSVLGTPEFMAPELYDESYDEKVDIYAFGMLLLEIITRDVPYHECANPAQIYKKVTQGIPPASLRRVKSEDARNFVLFCLGIGKDASERPSASELLKHPFLEKKPDDETTIEVEPAVEDMVIDEGLPDVSSESGSDRSGGKSEDVFPKGSKYSSSIDGHGIPTRASVESGEQSRARAESVSSSKPAAIPKEASKPIENEEQTDDQFGGMPHNEANMKKVTVLMGRGTALDEDSPLKETTESQITTPLQYKVSAVPREDFVEGSEPYPHDEINLALTLPDESRTTIEFDFDLVNDDPVQVAREMVTELEEVPDCAVLDISGAISGVAREARMKQNQWKKLQQQSAMAQQGMMMQGSMTMPPQGLQAQPQGLMMPQQQMYNSGYPSGSYPSTSAMHQQQQIQPQQIGSTPPAQQMPILPQHQPSHIGPPPPSLASTPDLANMNAPAPSMAMPQQHQQQVHNHQQQQQQPPPPPQPMSSQSPMVRPNSMSALPNQTPQLATPVQQLHQGTPVGQPPTPLPTSKSHSVLQESLSVTKQQTEPAQPEPSENASITTSTADASDRPSDGNLSEDLDVDSEVDAEEIRKLEQEFEKKMQRAKKSYGTRMDNLHRSKEEAEAQHQMTLEKHEKERIEFEKRVRLAEEEQARRLNQLEKEYIEKKKEFLKAGGGGAPPNNGDKPPLPSGHKRSNSQVVVPKPSTDHKRNVSDSDLDETQKVRERSDSLKGGHKLSPRTDFPPTFPKSGS